MSAKSEQWKQVTPTKFELRASVGDVVFHQPRFHANCNGHRVLEVRERAGGWAMPHYRVKIDDRSREVCHPNVKGDSAWLRQWMLITTTMEFPDPHPPEGATDE